jgi:hypothetical protein
MTIRERRPRAWEQCSRFDRCQEPGTSCRVAASGEGTDKKTDEPMEFLRKLADSIGRTPGESKLLGDSASVRAKYALLAVFATAAATIYLPALLQDYAEWNDFPPAVALPSKAWRVLLAKSPVPCALDASDSPGCPANAENPALWKSPLARSDADHWPRVRAMRNREYWIGAEISLKDLATAYRERANYLLLGLIRADYRIWVDGHLVNGGDLGNAQQIVVSLPIDRLRDETPLRVAIQIRSLSNHQFPDLLTGSFTSPGLYSSARVNSYLSLLEFVGRTRPFSLFVAHFIIGALFFMFWVTATTKQEYFYMAIYALLIAFYHLRTTEMIWSKFDPDKSALMLNMLYYLEGCFAFFLGLSLARARRALFRWAFTAALGFPLASLALKPSLWSATFANSFTNWFLPLGCFGGAAACLAQALELHFQAKLGSRHAVRLRRLLYFAAGLAAVGTIHYCQFAGLSGTMQYVFAYSLAHVGLVFLLAFIVLAEYRERERLLERVPVSEYHRRATLPESITGAMLVADLKDSEVLYRLRAEHGETENPVRIWRFHFQLMIAKYGGIAIQKKGDEIIGFFDADKCENPALAAVAAVEEITRASPLVESELRARQLLPEDSKGLHFRASIATGAIRPIWDNVGGERDAGWEEAGTTSVFVESARLLEMERKVRRPGDTVLILKNDLAEAVLTARPSLQSSVVARDLVVEDKHGTPYHIAVFVPQTEKSVELRSVA